MKNFLHFFSSLDLFKFQILLVFLSLTSAATLKADVGCLVNGSDIYRYPDGTYLYENAQNSIPRYSVSDKIHRQTWSGDACGIPASIMDKYSKPAGTSNNPNSKCVINSASYGTQIIYNPNDSNCVNLPLDDHINLIVLAMGGIGAYFLSRKGKLSF